MIDAELTELIRQLDHAERIARKLAEHGGLPSVRAVGAANLRRLASLRETAMLNAMGVAPLPTVVS